MDSDTVASLKYNLLMQWVNYTGKRAEFQTIQNLEDLGSLPYKERDDRRRELRDVRAPLVAMALINLRAVLDDDWDIKVMFGYEMYDDMICVADLEGKNAKLC